MSMTRKKRSFNSQHTLIYAAQLHFNIHFNGICAGYALTGALCFFSEKLDHFDYQIKSNYQSLTPFLDQDVSQTKGIDVSQFASPQELDILSAIFAFQKPKFFCTLFNKSYFNQNDITSLIFTSSLPSIASERNITILRQYLKFFTQRQLGMLISSLAQKAKTKLVFILSYNSHRISIGYHPTLNTYFYINANTAPTKPYLPPMLLKEFERLFANIGLKKINFYIRVLCLTSETDKINKSLKELENSFTFISLVTTNKHDFFMRTHLDDNLMHISARTNNVELLKKYSPYFDPNEQNKYGETPLHVACKSNHPEAAKVLLDNQKTEVDAITKNARTPLYYSAKRGNVEITRLLLGKGCNPFGTKTARSPLMHAVEENQVEILKTCREFGINLFKKNDKGKTLLDHATELQKDEIVDYLSSLENSTHVRFFSRHPRITGASLKNKPSKRLLASKAHSSAPEQKRQKISNS